MNRILIEQNPWWEDKNAITQDKDIHNYMNANVRFSLPAFTPKRGAYNPRATAGWKNHASKNLIMEKLSTGKPEGVFISVQKAVIR